MLYSITSGVACSFSLKKSFWLSFSWLTLRSVLLTPVGAINPFFDCLFKLILPSSLATFGSVKKNSYQVITPPFKLKVEQSFSLLRNISNNRAVLSGEFKSQVQQSWF